MEQKKKSKIFIVDDEADFCYFVKKQFDLHDEFEVVTCSDSEHALEMATDMKPDLILLDIMMPGKDGFAVLRELRAAEHTYKTPVIMLTAKGDSSSLFEGEKYRATDYFIKPFEMKDLLKYIKKYLEQ